MYFAKLKETIEAFRMPRDHHTMQDEIDEHAQKMKDSITGKAPEVAVRLGVYLAAVLPSSLLIMAILERLTRFEGATLGAIGIIVGLVAGALLVHFHDLMVRRIPFHKLNPFFGNKLDETIAAFRKSS